MFRNFSFVLGQLITDCVRLRDDRMEKVDASKVQSELQRPLVVFVGFLGNKEQAGRKSGEVL